MCNNYLLNTELLRHRKNPLQDYSESDFKNHNINCQQDSFCVNDSSELNTSSNMSVQRMSDERRQRTKKRKRISSPQSTTDSDSPNQFNRKLLHKRGRVKTSLDSSWRPKYFCNCYICKKKLYLFYKPLLYWRRILL